MSEQPVLRIDGAVDRPASVTVAELAGLPAERQLADVTQVDPGRPGTAVTLAGLLELVGVWNEADYLGLHSSHDDFHASIPLAPVRDRGLLIYELHGEPLDVKKGGPFRFYIPDHAACHTDEVDECANVKFVDHIEFTVGKGYDNRPQDDEEHAKLHEHD